MLARAAENIHMWDLRLTVSNPVVACGFPRFGASAVPDAKHHAAKSGARLGKVPEQQRMTPSDVLLHKLMDGGEVSTTSSAQTRREQQQRSRTAPGKYKSFQDCKRPA